MSLSLVLCTAPDKKTATNIANRLLDQKLAACVSFMPNMTSMFVWNGKRESASEVQMFIKAPAKNFSKISKLIQKHHPYEVPEILEIKTGRGLRSYVKWVNAAGPGPMGTG